jgi:multidrug efflux pump
VFLCLAALYESWSIPFSVLLVVPLGVIGAVLARGCSACRTTCTSRWPADRGRPVGEERDPDRGVRQGNAGSGHVAAGRDLQAVRLRLRPILMTSIAFGLGVLPLAISAAPVRAARTPSAPACWAAC